MSPKSVRVTPPGIVDRPPASLARFRRAKAISQVRTFQASLRASAAWGSGQGTGGGGGGRGGVGFDLAKREAPGTSSASVVRKFLRSIWVGKSLPNAEKSLLISPNTR